MKLLILAFLCATSCSPRRLAAERKLGPGTQCEVSEGGGFYCWRASRMYQCIGGQGCDNDDVQCAQIGGPQ